jgi:hypothetical protein
MVEFSIPSPGEVSEEASEFTKAEIADLSSTKRNTFLYERTIEHFKSQICFLEKLVTSEKSEKQEVINRCSSLEAEAKNAASLRRAKLEMFISFLLATIAMTIGGALISSYPINNGVAPWQFYLGWSMIVMAVVMGLFSRVLAWVAIYVFPKYFNDVA